MKVTKSLMEHVILILMSNCYNNRHATRKKYFCKGNQTQNIDVYKYINFSKLLQYCYISWLNIILIHGEDKKTLKENL